MKIFSSTLSVLLITITLSGQDPLGLRGTDRTGIYKEYNLPKVWPADGPELLWEYNDSGTGK